MLFFPAACGRSSTIVCTGRGLVRARVVLCSSDLASVEHFAIVSLRMYCSRSVFFNLYGVFSIFQAWFSSTRANPGFVRMKQIKMTARLIRTCDTCAHPYLYSSRTRYLVPGIYYDTATLLKQCSCVVPGRCTSRFCCMSFEFCLLYTSPSPRDKRQSRMPSSA